MPYNPQLRAGARHPVPEMLPFLLPAAQVLGLLTPLFSVQEPRPPVPVPNLGGEPTGAAYATGVEDAYAVVVQTYAATPGVLVAFQDSPGGNWTQPVARFVDPTSVGLCPTVMIVEGNVFVCWIERVTTLGGTHVDTMYFDVTEEPGDPWRGPELMAGDPNPGGFSVVDYRIASARSVGGQPAIHALVELGVPGAPTEELHFFTIRAFGGPLGAPLPVPDRPAQSAAIGEYVLRSAGGVAHVAWTDDRHGAGEDVFHRRIVSGAGSFAGEARLTAASGALGTGLALAASSALVAVAWLPEQGGADALAATVSLDGGFAFETAGPVGNYASGSDDVDAPALGLDAAGTTAVLAWADDRSGADHVYAASRFASASPWSADAPALPQPATAPALTRSTRAQGPLLLTAVGVGEFLGTLAFAAPTAWEAPFTLAPGALVYTMAAGAEHDPLYDDFALSWLAVQGGQVRQFVGGIRPQSVGVVGVLRAGLPVQFGVQRFPIAEAGDRFRVVVAGAPGGFLLPDARTLGLRNDAWLRASANRSELRSVLNANGAGLTVPLVLPLPVGTTIFYAAVSDVGGVAGTITDVRTATVAP